MRLRGTVYTIVLVAVLLICMNGPVFFLARHVVDRPLAGWEDPWVRPFFVVVALAGPALLATSYLGERSKRQDLRGRFIGIWRAIPWPIVVISAYVSLALISTTWSVAPHVTWLRAWIYVGLIPLAWWISMLPFTVLRTGVAWASGTAIAASVALATWWPTLGRMKDGSWQGVFVNRNSLAPVAALGLISATFEALDTRGARRIVGVAIAIASFVSLLATGNRTSLVALTPACVVASSVVLIGSVRSAYGRTASVMSGICLGFGILVGSSLVWRHISNTSSLQTRRLIWRLTLDLVRQRPWRGFGFFAGWDNPVVTRTLYERIGINFGSAHNSAIESLFGLGPIGLILFAAIAAIAVCTSIDQLWRRPSLESAFWTVISIVLVMENVTESFVLNYSYNWLLLTAAAIRAGLASFQRSSSGESVSLLSDDEADRTQGAQFDRSPRASER